MRKRLGRILLIIIAALLLTIIVTAVRIYSYGSVAVDTQADAAVVLGAAVWSQNISPVFCERINHAVDLYRQGKVRKVIFTGGQAIQMSQLRPPLPEAMPRQTVSRSRTS